MKYNMHSRGIFRFMDYNYLDIVKRSRTFLSIGINNGCIFNMMNSTQSVTKNFKYSHNYTSEGGKNKNSRVVTFTVIDNWK